VTTSRKRGPDKVARIQVKVGAGHRDAAQSGLAARAPSDERATGWAKRRRAHAGFIEKHREPIQRWSVRFDNASNLWARPDCPPLRHDKLRGSMTSAAGRNPIKSSIR
jgi:hypothetical protein